MAVKHKLRALWKSAHALGAAGTHVADMAIFGTRRTPQKTAGDALDRRSASGIGPHSVWQGPHKVIGGAPVLRRNRPA